MKLLDTLATHLAAIALAVDLLLVGLYYTGHLGIVCNNAGCIFNLK